MSRLRQGYVLEDPHILPPPISPRAPGAEATPEARESDLLDRARTEAEHLKERGYREGLETGRARAEAEMRPHLENLASILGRLQAERDRLSHDLEGEVLRLVLQIAADVLRAEVSANPQVVLRMVRHGLERMGRRESIRLRVNPREANLVSSALPAAASGEVEILADASVEPGGCILESPTGSLDLRPSAQLEEIRRELLAEHCRATEELGP